MLNPKDADGQRPTQPDPNIFWWVAASVTDAPALNPNGIKTLLANGLSTIFTKGNPVFSNGPKRLVNTWLSCFMQLSFWQFYVSRRVTCESFTKLWNFCIGW